MFRIQMLDLSVQDRLVFDASMVGILVGYIFYALATQWCSMREVATAR